MIYFLQKIRHYLSANSRHGTHSPFVYALADELIYNKNINRGDSLMEDIITYFDSKGVERPAFFITHLSAHSVEDLLSLQDVYFMIFVKDIHRKTNHRKIWKSMRTDKNFVVLIDLFEFGIICKRKEQPKENFKLRYPYSFY
jgi:hypothetical protein